MGVKTYTGERGSNTLEGVRAYFAEQERKRARGSLRARTARWLAVVGRQLFALLGQLVRQAARVISRTPDARPSFRGVRIGSRRALTTTFMGVLVVLLGTAAWAFWSSTGSGAGVATTGTLNPPTGTTVSSVAGSGTVSVSWTAPTSGATPTGYTVSRTPIGGGSAVAACGTGTTPVATLTCSDTSVPDGSYTYIATSIRGNWTAAGTASSSVTVTNTIATTTTVASSPTSTSVVGQAVTYTATVTQASGATKPTGSVTFKDGSSPINCSGGTQTLNNGTATCALAYTSAGTHSITALYSPTGVFTTSTSSPLSFTVGPAATTTTLTSSVNPSVTGQSITYTATVATQSPGTGTPAGTVAFKDGATTITGCGTQVLSGGVATCQVTYTTVTATRTISAGYQGTTDYSASTGSITQNMNKASTSTALVSSANPSVVGQTVSYTATVSTVSPGTGIPSGSVAFTDGGTTITGCGAKALNASGVATCSSPYTAVSAGRTIAATFAATSDYATSTASITQVISQASTTTALTSSVNPSVVGQSVTYSATVAAVSPGSGTPTGSVTFKDGGTNISTCTSVALNGSGVATCTITTYTTVNAGRTITAAYTATANFAASTSTSLMQVVGKANTSVALSTSGSPAKSGVALQLTATVSASSPGAGTPTGTVTFKDGNTTLTCQGGTSALNSGTANCITTFSTTGAKSITAVYSGDSNFSTSTSSVLTQRIVDGTVVGFGFTNVKVNGATAAFTCTGFGSSTTNCTVTNAAGNGASLSADVQFVNGGGAATVYATDQDSVLSWGAAKSNPTLNQSATILSGASVTTGSALSGSKTGSNQVIIAVRFTDGLNTFNATLTLN